MMTNEILDWLMNIRRDLPFSPGRVLEISAQDINGTVRPLFDDATEYIACDMQEGKGVDRIMLNNRIVETFGVNSFDTIICCEGLEHDRTFMSTVTAMREALRVGGHLIITTPTVGFPYHPYPRDYWRFTKDAYEDVFFDGMTILDISTLDNAYAPQISLAGIAGPYQHQKSTSFLRNRINAFAI